jgi:hypothetical protein
MSNIRVQVFTAQMLWDAVLTGDPAAFSRVLPEGSGTPEDLSAPDFRHWEPGNPRCLLSVATQMGSTEIVRVILERAPNTPVDFVDAAGAGTAMPQWRARVTEVDQNLTEYLNESWLKLS